jgi:hypothetical protein
MFGDAIVKVLVCPILFLLAGNLPQINNRWHHHNFFTRRRIKTPF